MVDEHTLQGLFHAPYGEEHPYEQLPTERTPRDPVAGQPTVLGVATHPAGAADAVWSTWAVQGVEGEATAAAIRAGDEGEQSRWRAELPGFEPGRRVTYRLHARQGKRVLSTGDYSFFVPGWHTAGRVIGCRLAGDCLEVECDGKPWRTHLTIALHGARSLRLRWAALPQPPSGGAASSYPSAAEGTSGPAASSTLLGGEGERPAWTVEESSAEQLCFRVGDLRLLVGRCPCRLQVQSADGTVLLSEAEPANWLVGEDGQILRLRQTFASPPDEAFYGFGERYNALDERGNTLDVRVYAQFTAQGRRTYLPVPFFISSQGYGLYLATARHLAYDLAASQPDQWRYDAELGPAGSLEAYLFVGEPGQMLAGYADLTGKPALPPIWAFGPWMSGNEWNSQAVVMEQVHETAKYGIPATVLVIEAWSDESTYYIWNDARYMPKLSSEPFSYGDLTFPPEGRWPDPKGMIDELHRRGMRLLLWQVPVLKRLAGPHPQHDADVAYAIEQGYCVREASGRPYRIRPEWFRGGLLLDFTNPDAVDWWLAKRAYLLDELGIDGFKTDGGEHLSGCDLRFADGRRSDELWNLYPNLYVGAYHHFARQKRGGDAITFSRAGFAGAQRYPCHWAGDEHSTWQGFRSSIVAGLSAGISGIPFWGWDLAGFTGEIPSAELYLRAAAMAAFCPIMQYHMDYNAHRQPSRDRTPWNIQARTGDADVIPAFRYYANLRMNLLPYIYSEAVRCSEAGLPLMCALPLAFPGDRACRDYPYQYLFGQSLLVAPVVSEGCTEQSVYLPAGRWHDLWSGAVHHGPQVLTCPTPKDHIPVFVRAGAILPLNLGDTYALGSSVGNAVDRYRHLCLRIYPEGERSYTWHDAAGKAHTLRCTAHEGNAGMEIELPALPCDVALAVHNPAPRAVTVDGRPLARTCDLAAWRDAPAGAWAYDEATGQAWIGLAAGPARTVTVHQG